MDVTHEVECALAAACRFGEAGQHDWTYDPSQEFCRLCERFCLCRQLQARAKRAVVEYVQDGAVGDAWTTAGQVHRDATLVEDAAERRGFDKGLVAGPQEAGQ